MTVRVSDEWAYRGLQALVLENEELRVVILPELGGKIWQITGVRTNRDFLWHNPRVGPRQVPFGSNYDDNFFGGWDELFPNDVAEQLADELFPDHGELWSSPWSWSIEQENEHGAAVRLTLRTPISGCLIEKRVVLESAQASLQLHYRLTNTLPRELPYLWKQHLAVPVSEKARIGIGATSMYLEHFGRPRAGQPGETYAWPELHDSSGQAIDMSQTLPASSVVSEFQYATELAAGWCAVTYEDGTGIGLAFDRDVFRSCWLFSTYGGWRGLQTVILEPCTGYPVEVSGGVDRGTHQVLAPGQVVQTTVTAVVYDQMAEVTGIRPDGGVDGRRLTGETIGNPITSHEASVGKGEPT